MRNLIYFSRVAISGLRFWRGGNCVAYYSIIVKKLHSLKQFVRTTVATSHN